MKYFTSESLSIIIPWIENEFKESSEVSFSVVDPDVAPTLYAGEYVTCNDTLYMYRGYKAWTDLAESLHCRMMTPRKEEKYTITLRFIKLGTNSFHQSNENKQEKYGVSSEFFRLHKQEEPAFFHAFTQALNLAHLHTKKRILDLGVNRGDEFQVIQQMLHVEEFKTKECLGIDHSTTAIYHAQTVNTHQNVHFLEGDINTLEMMELGVFDLILSIGTLQSPGINFKERLMMLTQKMLTKDGAFILGFPNCRWCDGEILYGAKIKNFKESEMSLLIKDIYFAKKYFQQHKFDVRIFGKQYLFLVAARHA